MFVVALSIRRLSRLCHSQNYTSFSESFSDSFIEAMLYSTQEPHYVQFLNRECRIQFVNESYIRWARSEKRNVLKQRVNRKSINEIGCSEENMASILAKKYRVVHHGSLRYDNLVFE